MGFKYKQTSDVFRVGAESPLSTAIERQVDWSVLMLHRHMGVVADMVNPWASTRSRAAVNAQLREETQLP